MKDYYAILECTPLSTVNDIKKSYRKLAQQYHPDKKPNDPYAAAKFQDLKEAYETLTQPTRKEAWLNERWLHQVQNTFYAEVEPLTPVLILKKLLKLDRELSNVDNFRMDQVSYVKEVENILNDENMECLKRFNDTEIKHTILVHLLSCTKPFDYTYLRNVWERLFALANGNDSEIKLIERIRSEKKKKHIQQQWTVPIVIFITILLLLMMKWLS